MSESPSASNDFMNLGPEGQAKAFITARANEKLQRAGSIQSIWTSDVLAFEYVRTLARIQSAVCKSVGDREDVQTLNSGTAWLVVLLMERLSLERDPIPSTTMVQQCMLIAAYVTKNCFQDLLAHSAAVVEDVGLFAFAPEKGDGEDDAQADPLAPTPPGHEVQSIPWNAIGSGIRFLRDVWPAVITLFEKCRRMLSSQSAVWLERVWLGFALTGYDVFGTPLTSAWDFHTAVCLLIATAAYYASERTGCPVDAETSKLCEAERADVDEVAVLVQECADKFESLYQLDSRTGELLAKHAEEFVSKSIEFEAHSEECIVDHSICLILDEQNALASKSALAATLQASPSAVTPERTPTLSPVSSSSATAGVPVTPERPGSQVHLPGPHNPLLTPMIRRAVPHTPSRSATKGTVVPHTPIRAAFSNAQWLLRLVADRPDGFPAALREALCTVLPNCDDVVKGIEGRVAQYSEVVRFDSLVFRSEEYTKRRRALTTKLYYLVLERIVQDEIEKQKKKAEETTVDSNKMFASLRMMFGEERFYRALYAAALETALFCHQLSSCTGGPTSTSSGNSDLCFPKILELFKIEPFEFHKETEFFVMHVPHVPDAVRRHFARLVDTILETLVWKEDSPLVAYLLSASDGAATDSAQPTPGSADGSNATSTTPYHQYNHMRCAEFMLTRIRQLASFRIQALALRLGVSELSDVTYSVFHELLTDAEAVRKLFIGRHLDQIILCCLYAVLKIRGLIASSAKETGKLSFKMIIRTYRHFCVDERQLPAERVSSVYHFVWLGTMDEQAQPVKADIIRFYNEIFIQMAKYKVFDCDRRESQTGSSESTSSDQPALPQMPKVVQTPKRNVGQHVVVSPMRGHRVMMTPKHRVLYAFVDSPLRKTADVSRKRSLSRRLDFSESQANALRPPKAPKYFQERLKNIKEEQIDHTVSIPIPEQSSSTTKPSATDGNA